jgi:alginate O-acetyltransferase complex protein AlgI
MVFNSIHFLLFFPVVTVVFFLLQHKQRWWWLLGTSCYFYMAFRPEYILILLFTIIIDYFVGIKIEDSSPKNKKTWFVLSLIANIGVLAVFKYYNFFTNSTETILADFGYTAIDFPFLAMALPIGLSFHTFQAMSYTFEVYLGNQKAERHFGLYALYVMFYPQLVAGPIERPQNVIPQFYKKHTFELSRVQSGLQLMVWGFFKKIIVADRLSPFVDQVYNNPLNYQGFPFWVATIFFSFQIYCDFSGYTDIAIGAARVMGFDLMKNFDRPYSSTTISEFWRRWHISLSTWFRDYLYIPLGGNRVKISRAYFNLFFVFLISGLWHGANWNYLIWGGLHGFFLVFALIIKPVKATFNKFVKENSFIRFTNRIITFLLVTYAWSFFRADYLDTSKAWYIYNNFFGNFPTLENLKNISFIKTQLLLSQETKEFILAIFFIFVLECIQYLHFKYNLKQWIDNKSSVFQWLFYLFVAFVFILFGVYESNAQFIYFQF